MGIYGSVDRGKVPHAGFFIWTERIINGFFSRLQAQSDQIAGWSDSTIDKIRGVLLRSLV